MFRTVPLSIIRTFSLYTQQWCMSYRFADSLRAGSEFPSDPARNLSPNLYDIYHSSVYSEISGRQIRNILHVLVEVMCSVQGFSRLSQVSSCLNIPRVPFADLLHRSFDISFELKYYGSYCCYYLMYDHCFLHM